jgi:preprotein translocase SecE subunit
MMTAILGGIMFLSAAAWSWGQLEKVHIPTPRWDLPLASVPDTSALKQGQSVKLTKEAEGQSQLVADAVIESVATSGRSATIRIGDVSVNGTADPRDANHLEVAGAPGSTAPAFVATVSHPTGIPLFPLVYLQAGISAILVLTGAFLIYWLVGVKPGPVDFLIATDGEMKKVNWSTKKVIRDSTYVVIGATFILVAVIYIADYVFLKLFMAMGVLGGGAA